jgi:anti-anti-sigma factor
MTLNVNTLTIVKPSGLLDGIQAPHFRQNIEAMLAEGSLHIVVDLGETSFIDSSGLGAMVAALKRVRAVGGDLYLCGMNRQVQMVFELTSMDRAFTIYDTLEDLEAARKIA